MIKYSIDKAHPTRDLTPHEKVFLQGLAEYKLFLDKSLFFQIEDLQKHTELVLSGETEKTAYRYEFPDPDELDMEIEELEKMIKELEGKQEYWELLELLKEQLKKLKEALLKEEYGIKTTRLLGKYSHNHGDDSMVTLYINNIEHAAGKDPYKTMLLMGQVMLHEYFHSFYYHVGLGTQHAFNCAEEPMAEYGSLVMLDNVASSIEHLAPIANDALKYTFNKVKRKQTCTGKTAAYGFGAYLFDAHKNDYPLLIARYANVSSLLKVRSKEASEYKYMVYPTYPCKKEKTAYEKLKNLIESGEKSIEKLGVDKATSTKKGIKRPKSTLYDFEKNFGVHPRVWTTIPVDIAKSKSLGKGATITISFYDQTGAWLFDDTITISTINRLTLTTDIQAKFMDRYGLDKVPFGFREVSPRQWEAHEL